MVVNFIYLVKKTKGGTPSIRLALGMSVGHSLVNLRWGTQPTLGRIICRQVDLVSSVGSCLGFPCWWTLNSKTNKPFLYELVLIMSLSQRQKANSNSDSYTVRHYKNKNFYFSE